MKHKLFFSFVLTCIVILLVLIGCSGAATDSTLISSTSISGASLSENPSTESSPDATNTAPKSTESTSIPTTTKIVTKETTSIVTYQVAFVADDNELNVRADSGTNYEILTSLAHNVDNIHVIGSGKRVQDIFWVPINYPGGSGWASRYYLTESVTSDAFCSDPNIQTLIEDLRIVIEHHDGGGLANLIYYERGLLIRHDWWNEEVHLEQDAVEQFFSSETRHYWGEASGSGLSINGSITETIIPFLEKDLLADVETKCNEIIGGGTAGILRLPSEYDSFNFISLYRAGEEDFDWGTWVVGIEFWDRVPYLVFLVHYQWEI
ncbi:MAG: hypothetical protein B6242_01175 [Anaerolineaceae bacterium 4572_78]|nr:MAG: hypothetical protein B6242_01175 [Anaerolineaceae bacterium 4572_78]